MKTQHVIIGASVLALGVTILYVKYMQAKQNTPGQIPVNANTASSGQTAVNAALPSASTTPVTSPVVKPVMPSPTPVLSPIVKAVAPSPTPVLSPIVKAVVPSPTPIQYTTQVVKPVLYAYPQSEMLMGFLR